GRSIRPATRNRNRKSSPFPQQPENERQHGAEQQAGREWEIEFEIVTLDADVAGQSAQRQVQLSPQPHQAAERRETQADDHQDFADVTHSVPPCWRSSSTTLLCPARAASASGVSFSG